MHNMRTIRLSSLWFDTLDHCVCMWVCSMIISVVGLGPTNDEILSVNKRVKRDRLVEVRHQLHDRGMGSYFR